MVYIKAYMLQYARLLKYTTRVSPSGLGNVGNILAHQASMDVFTSDATLINMPKHA